MKLAALTLTLALAAAAAHAQSTPPKGVHEHGAPPPCCDTGAKAFQASGVVKKADAAKSTVTVAHGPVKDLNWPAMTMTFKVKNRTLLDRLAVNRQVAFSFVQEGKEYVITAVQ